MLSPDHGISGVRQAGNRSFGRDATIFASERATPVSMISHLLKKRGFMDPDFIHPEMLIQN